MPSLLFCLCSKPFSISSTISSPTPLVTLPSLLCGPRGASRTLSRAVSCRPTEDREIGMINNYNYWQTCQLLCGNGHPDLWFCKRKQSLSIFREERREGRRGDAGRRGVLDACPPNMILSSEVSGPVPMALSSAPPSSLPAIRLLFCPCSSPSPCSMEHCFLISVGFKEVWGHRVSSFVRTDCWLYGQPIISIVLFWS